MAELSPSPGSGCPVCLEDYRQARHQPKQLGCGHSLCDTCARRLMSRRQLGLEPASHLGLYPAAARQQRSPNQLVGLGGAGRGEATLAGGARAATQQHQRGAPSAHIECPVCRRHTEVADEGLPTNFALVDLLSQLGADEAPEPPPQQVAVPMGGREEEIESVCAIYPECRLVPPDADADGGGGAAVLHVALPRHCGAGEQLELCFRLPPAYPSADCATFELAAPWLSAAARRALVGRMHEAYARHIGEPVLFQWIELARDQLAACAGADEAVADGGPQPGTSGGDCAEGDDGSHDAADTPADRSHSQSDDDEGEGARRAALHVCSGAPFSDRKSTFQAHLAPVHSRQEVAAVLSALLSNNKIARATHNIYAYRIVPAAVDGHSATVVISDCADDGEHGAGAKLLHLLEVTGASDVLVVVTRWYGGVHLGPDRFRHINNAARALLVARGYDSRAAPAAGKKRERGAGGGRKQPRADRR